MPGCHSLRNPGRQRWPGGRHQEREGPLLRPVCEEWRGVSEVAMIRFLLPGHEDIVEISRSTRQSKEAGKKKKKPPMKN